MAFPKLFETDEEETARLAQAPRHSTNHTLSSLPVTNSHPDQYHLVELPWSQLHRCPGVTGNLSHGCDGTHRVVVLPLTFHLSSDDKTFPRQHNGSWDCRIVASDHPSYPVGGYDICCSESELRRGRVLEI